ncbi:MAG: CcdB family protein [Hyphomicrobium sp.]
MEQYDVYRLRRGDVVVILQHDTYRDFGTRIVALLISRSGAKLATSLNPILSHAGREWVLATHLMSVVTVSDIKENLGSIANRIMRSSAQSISYSSGYEQP